MKISDLLKFEEELRLEKKTVVILRWIALIGQLITVYVVHFILKLDLPLIFCSLTIFCGGLTNIFIHFNFKKNQLSNLESTILLFYDVIQLGVLLYLTGGVTNPFVIFLIVPAIVSSTLLNLASTFFLSFITIISLLLITFNHYPLPSSGNLHFHVPEFYIYSIPMALTIVLIFLNYFGFRFGFEARKRGNALSKLESVLSKEQELDSIGHQAAAAAHSLGTPLSTITVIARELKKEVSKSEHFYDDIDTLLNQARKCGEILKKLSKREIISDDYMTYTSIQDLLNEISKSFEENSQKKIILNFDKAKKKIPIIRSSEITYGIRNFVGNAVKFSDKKVNINLISSGKNLIIEILDDGPGYPPDVIKFIGEPYISSKSKKIKNKSGLGLGSFIGKTLLERKKASIEFDNIPNSGAKVQITWSLSDITI